MSASLLSPNDAAAPRVFYRVLIPALLVLAAGMSWWHLGRQGLTTWDEGVYFDEARFVVQAAGALRAGSAADIAQATSGFAPRMGRPLNTALNAAAMAVLGIHPWVPAALAGLFGVLSIALTFALGRRLFGLTAGTLAALLLTLSPYFLQYRRTGLPEAAGACLGLLILSRLVALRDAAERRPWLNSLGLGLMLGVAFTINMRLGILLPVAMLFRLCWLPGRRDAGRLAGHLLAMAGGSAALLVACELPYLLLPLFAPAAPPVESYFQQLARFALTQRHMGRPPLHLSYLAPLVFLAYFDLPVLLLSAFALTRRRSWREPGPALLGACVLAQFVALGFITPFARYLSWILPLLMILAAGGLTRLMAAPGVRRRVPLVVVTALLLAAYPAWRDGPVLRARGQMSAAADWLKARPAAAVVTSDASVLMAYLGPAEPLPLAPPQARELIARLGARGPCYVLLDRQRFMNEALVMTPEQYDRSAGGIIARVAIPVWQTSQFKGLFVPFAFEHNRDILATLRSIRGKSQGEKIAIYTAAEALRVLPER